MISTRGEWEATCKGLDSIRKQQPRVDIGPHGHNTGGGGDSVVDGDAVGVSAVVSTHWSSEAEAVEAVYDV